MANAKEEFRDHVVRIMIANRTNLKCATIDYTPFSFRYRYEEEDEIHTVHMLPVDYTQEEYDAFVDSLDFTYDDGYGLQELYGYIWFTDGTYSDRHEYDGSEHWDYHRAPGIPVSLIKSTI